MGWPETYGTNRKKRDSIAETLYPGYQLLFLFDNATSHSVYAEDALLASKMNKGDGGRQPLLRNGWYKIGNTTFVQEMFYSEVNTATGAVMKIPKGIERIPRERNLWPDCLNAPSRVVNLAKHYRNAKTVSMAPDASLANSQRFIAVIATIVLKFALWT